jgi:hypothetical protein
MALKVKELIELLKQQDPEARVLAYENEDYNGALDVWSKTEAEHPEDGLYYKGGSPVEVWGKDFNYVIIADQKKD